MTKRRGSREDGRMGGWEDEAERDDRGENGEKTVAGRGNLTKIKSN